MPGRAQYPLQTLLELRRQARQKAERVLAEAMEKTARSERLVSAAVREVSRRQTELEERRRTNRRGGNATQLHQLRMKIAYEDRLAAEVEAATEALEEARRAEAAARREEAEAKSSLQEAYKELEALKKHHQRWRAEERRAEQKAAEENAEEIIQSQVWQRDG
jgi:flagellar biosynthesis chaperone FliJ